MCTTPTLTELEEVGAEISDLLCRKTDSSSAHQRITIAALPKILLEWFAEIAA